MRDEARHDKILDRRITQRLSRARLLQPSLDGLAMKSPTEYREDNNEHGNNAH